MAFQKPKLGLYTLGGPESVHITKDPPKSYVTRKKEFVSEVDVMHNFRAEPERFTENIQKYARGQNPHVSVSLSNGENAQAQNPYKVNRDGAFRPPLLTQEDTMPLSRQKHSSYAVRPTFLAPAEKQHNVEAKIDKQNIKTAVHASPMYNNGITQQENLGNKILDPLRMSHSGNPTRPGLVDPSGYQLFARTKDDPLHTSAQTRAQTSHKDIGLGEVYLDPALNIASRTNPTSEYRPSIETSEPHSGIIIRPSTAVQTGLGAPVGTMVVQNLGNGDMKRFIQDKPLQSYLTPVFNIAIAGADTQISAPKLKEKDKLFIVQRINAGLPVYIPGQQNEHISLKDYKWYIHQPNPGGKATLVITHDERPDVFLKPSRQVTSVRANISAQYETMPDNARPILDGRPTIVVNGVATRAIDIDNITPHTAKLNPRLRPGGFENPGSQPTQMYHHQPFVPSSAIRSTRTSMY